MCHSPVLFIHRSRNYHWRCTGRTHTVAPNGYSLLVVGVPQSGGLFGGTRCKLYPPTPPLRRPGRPFFWGSRPCVPATWLAERLLLAGDIESNPGPRPTLKTPTHTHTQPPPPLTKYTDSLIQPPRACPPPLYIDHPPPKTPTYTSSPPAPTLTPYTLDQIQPVRPDSPHISPPHKPPYVPTPAHSHTHNKQKTPKTKHKEIKILQLNANGIRSTVEELKHLLLTSQPDVVTVQESKLNQTSRTPKIPKLHCHPHRQTTQTRRRTHHLHQV